MQKRLHPLFFCALPGAERQLTAQQRSHSYLQLRIPLPTTPAPLRQQKQNPPQTARQPRCQLNTSRPESGRQGLPSSSASTLSSSVKACSPLCVPSYQSNIYYLDFRVQGLPPSRVSTLTDSGDAHRQLYISLLRCWYYPSSLLGMLCCPVRTRLLAIEALPNWQQVAV